MFELAVPFLILFPLTLAYVLIVQRAMDVRVLLRLGTRYAAAQGSVYLIEIVIAASVVWLAVIPLIERTDQRWLSRLIAGALIGLVSWAFIASNGLGKRLERWIDRRFFREAYDAEIVLSELSEQARRLPDKELLLETVARRVSEVLHVPQISVWLRAANCFQL